MRYRPIVAAMLIAILGSGHAEESGLKDDRDRESYSVGFQIGTNFKRQGIEVKPETFATGIQDALSGKNPAMTKEEMEKSLSALQQRVGAAQQQQHKDAADKNLAAGKSFLEENAKKPGVVTTASGLQYKIIQEGGGAKPKATDSVTVNYRGTLLDGKEFDSSYSRKEPATFRLDQVIKGWTEGLQLIKQGSKAQFFIPPSLAYGERGAGPIGPNSTLVFDVELISIEAPAKTAEPEKTAGGKKKK